MVQQLTTEADSWNVGVIDRTLLPHDDPVERVNAAAALAADEPESGASRWGLSFFWQVAMLTLSGVVMILSVRGLRFQVDFNGDLYEAGLRIVNGISPYDINLIRHEAAVFGTGGTFHPVVSPRWPAPVLLLAVPFTLLPIQVAGSLFMAISVAAVFGGMRLLGVRDPRCLLVAVVSTPTVTGVILGNISPLIFFGAALAWRSRPRHLITAATTAGVVVAKLFLWPLGVWLLISQGRRAGIRCALLAALGVLGGWMFIGFHGLAAYPAMVEDVAKIGEPRGCSLVAFLMYMGFGVGPARYVAFTAAFGLLYLAGKLVRRPGCERQAFGLVVIAALTATPVVWDHYMVLLFVPIALLSPQISWLWFLPTLAAFAPTAATRSYGMGVLPMLLGELVLTVVLCEPLLSEPALRYWRSMVATAKAAAPS